MRKYTQGIGKMECLKGLEFICFRQERDMKASFSKDKNMGKAFIIIRMAIITKGIGRMI